jgi:hypothetical protein
MTRQRFYERDPSLKQAVETMLLFPEDIQEIIAAGFSEIAQRDYQLKEILDNLKSLGADTIMAFHKSKRKQREYDKNPVVHKAMNDLRVISPENQVLLARRTLELMGCLQNYLKLCKQFNMPPRKDILQSIAVAYIDGCVHQANMQLNQVGRKFEEQRPTQTRAVLPQQNKPPLASSEAVRSKEDGMRIKGTILDS